MPTQEQLYRQLAVSNPLIQEDIDSQVIERDHIIDTDEESGKEIDTVLKTIERDPVRSFKEGIGSQATGTITKEQLKNIGKFGSQFGLDVLTGSAIAEALGFRPDIIQGEGYTPSYPELVEETAQLAKEGKRTEALGKGIETGLVGVGAVGEGMMLGGALTGPLAPAIIGAGLTLKGISKAGKLILQSKTGQKILANFTGSKDTGYNVTDIEIPKNITEDKEIQTLEEIKDIPTIKTDDTDTEVTIPDVAKDLNNTEAITGYIIDPSKLDRNQLVAKIENDPEVKIKTDKYLKDKGFTGDTIPIYRIISVKDKTKGFGLDQKLIQKAEIGEEGIISGSLTPEANIKTIKYFENKGTTEQEIVRYDVPRDRIILAMGGFKNDIKQNINKNLKSRGFGQRKISGYETITNPSESAKKLIDMQDEVIVDVSGLKKNVLGSPSVLVDFNMDKVLSGEYKNYKELKKDLTLPNFLRDDFRNLANKKISEDEFRKIEDVKTRDAYNKVMQFYQLQGPPVFSRVEEAVKNLKQEKGKGKDIFNEIQGKFRREEGEWIGLEKFLKDKESVTKEEILEYIRENDIPIKTKVREGKETIHKKYTIGGGKNYREITFYPELPMDGRRDYKPSHNYPEDLNLISRVRVVERIDADGNPTMHIEEAQSEHRNDILENKKQTYEQTGEIGLIDDKETTEKLNNLLKERVPLRSTLGAKIKKLRHEHNLDDITEKGKLALQQELDLLIIRRENSQNIISEEGFNPGTYSKTILAGARKKYVDHTKRIKELKYKRNVMIARETDFHDNVITMDKDIPSLQNKISKLNEEIKAIERTRKVPSLPYSTDRDWYKYPIRYVMYDAAEKGLPSITLTHGRVQYNRYTGKDDFLSYNREIDKIKASEKISKNFDEFVKDAHKLINLNEEIRLKKKLLEKQILEPSPNTDHHEIYRDITQLNAKTEEEYTKIFHKYGLNMLEPEVKRNILNDLLKVANITGDKKFKKQHMLKLFNINSSARVGYNYDTKMKSYLEDLAKQYNTTVDRTIVDSDMNSGDSHRLHLTPEVRAKILKEGIAKFKTGGYIKERI